MILHERWFLDESKFPVQFGSWNTPNALIPVAVAVAITAAATLIYRVRDRHTVAGAKDDRRDALVLADSLRTDMRAFRRVLPLDAELIELTELIRIEEDLRRDENGLINRLSP